MTLFISVFAYIAYLHNTYLQKSKQFEVSWGLSGKNALINLHRGYGFYFQKRTRNFEIWGQSFER